jgi:hypothetical protein
MALRRLTLPLTLTPTLTPTATPTLTLTPKALLASGLYEESCIIGCAFFTAFGAIRNAAGLAPRAPPRRVASHGEHGASHGDNGAKKQRRSEEVAAVPSV